MKQRNKKLDNTKVWVHNCSPEMKKLVFAIIKRGRYFGRDSEPTFLEADNSHCYYICVETMGHDNRGWKGLSEVRRDYDQHYNREIKVNDILAM